MCGIFLDVLKNSLGSQHVLKFPTMFPTMFSSSQPCSQQCSQAPNHVPKDSKGEFGLFYLLLISALLPGALGIRVRDEYCLPNTQGAAFFAGTTKFPFLKIRSCEWITLQIIKASITINSKNKNKNKNVIL
jgi:hypothetical protein